MAEASSTLLFRPGLKHVREVRRRELAAFLRTLCDRVTGGRAVTCLITTDDELRELNRKFRGEDRVTDVLSFPSDGGQILGELAISLDRAATQATELRHSLEEELRVLMLHGVLHLTGMDHENDGGEMARAELQWRKK